VGVWGGEVERDADMGKGGKQNGMESIGMVDDGRR
jgi:hypothetical protein